MSKINYTIHCRKDGFGSQYQAIMSGIAYSKFKNYNYIHSPMRHSNDHLDEHNNYDIKSLNNFIGIPESEKNENIDIRERYSKIVHFSTNPSEFYTKDTINILKNYYYSTPKPVIENIDIAIHIRRGDVTYESHPKRFIPLSYYNKVIEFLNKKYPKYNIVIISEGSVENFNELNGKNLSFKLNQCIEEAFHSLVSAKILVTTKSSFSYCAAILNSNKIYYINFWHKPLNHWKILDEYIKKI